MPFQYSTPRNDYAGTIADLLERPGAIEAAKAMTIANARARAAEASGQAWSGAARDIGQSVSGAVQQLADPRRKLEAIALADAEHQAAGKKAMAGLMTPRVPNGPQPEGAGPAAPQNPYLKADGDVSVWDVEGLSKAMAAQGFGDLTPQVVKDIGGLNQAHRDEAAARAAYGTAQQAVVGKAAGTILGVLRDHPDADPRAVVTLVGQQLAANKTFPPEQLQKILDDLLSDPSQLVPKLQMLSRLGGGAPIKLGEKERLLNPNDPSGAPLVAAQVEPKAPTEASLALSAAGGDPMKAMALLKPPPQGPNSQEADFRLDGKDVKGDYLPGQHGQPGRYFYNGEDVTARALKVPPASSVTDADAKSYAKDIGDSIIQGLQPPDIKGLYRYAAPVRAYLASQGYDLKTMNLDWQAVQKHIATMNGAQQLRLTQSINALPDLLDSVEALADQWKGGSFPLLNKANLALAKGGAYGDKAASIANRLTTQIADVTADLGSVYMGGNSPTDHALDLAGTALKGEWSEKVLRDMIAQARTNVRIRKGSIESTGAAGLSTGLVTPPGPPSPTPPGAPPALTPGLQRLQNR